MIVDLSPPAPVYQFLVAFWRGRFTTSFSASTVDSPGYSMKNAQKTLKIRAMICTFVARVFLVLMGCYPCSGTARRQATRLKVPIASHGKLFACEKVRAMLGYLHD